MTRDEEIAVLEAAEHRVYDDKELDDDIVKSVGTMFAGAARAMRWYPDHTPDALDTLLYMAEHVEDYIATAKLIKGMAK